MTWRIALWLIDAIVDEAAACSPYYVRILNRELYGLRADCSGDRPSGEAARPRRRSGGALRLDTARKPGHKKDDWLDEEAGIEAALESYLQGRVVEAKRAREIIDAALGR